MAPKRRERWYSVDGQRRIHQSALQNNTGPRRLVSLIALLILVMIMIKQVSDPNKVAKVGGAVGLFPKEIAKATQSEDPTQLTQPPSSDPGNASESNLSAESQELNSDIEALGLVSLDPTIQRNSQVLEYLMRSLSTDGKKTLVGRIFDIVDRSKNPALEATNSTEALTSWLNESRTTLARWISLSQSQSTDNPDLVDLKSSLDAWANLPSHNEIANLPAAFRRSLSLALDRTLLSELSDNTPWRTNERLTLARTLMRASELAIHFNESFAIDAVPSVAVPQLLSQTDSLRGKCYRLQGTIGLIDQSSSMELAEARKLSYGVLWIRPDDLSNQPINVFVPDGVLPNRELSVGDNVQVAGLIVKRRAYASQRGGEITPVLIATNIQVDAIATSNDSKSRKYRGLIDRSVRIAKELSLSRNVLAWTPPIDRQAPLDLIQQGLSKHLQKIPSEQADWIQPESLAKSASVLASIANLVKFENEIDTVVSGGNNAMLSIDSIETHSNQRIQPVLGTWQGYATNARKLSIDPDLLPGLDWKEVYAVELETSAVSRTSTDRNNLSTVIAKDIPELWKSAQTLYQPIVIQGLGIASFGASDPPTDTIQSAPKMILASRIGWESQSLLNNLQANSDNPPTWIPPLSPTHTQLVQQGWDLAHCDMLEKLHGQSLTAKESRAFYTLLAASNLSRISLANQTTKNNADKNNVGKVMDWIRKTESMKATKINENLRKRSVAELIQTRVQIRRIQRVDVRNEQHRKWLGSNHYYQLDGIADIGANRIEVKYGKNYEPITYEKDFPITLVATEIPGWVLSDPSTLNGSEEQLNQNSSDLDSAASIAWSTKIRLDVMGYAYRIWKFKTPQVSAATDDTGFQQAPMLIAFDWKLAKGPSESEKQASRKSSPMASLVTTLVGLAAIGWFTYRMISRSQKNNSKGLQKNKVQVVSLENSAVHDKLL